LRRPAEKAFALGPSADDGDEDLFSYYKKVYAVPMVLTPNVGAESGITSRQARNDI